MPSSRSEELFLLIRSLSKSEKRSFRLFAGRSQDEADMLYLQLFDLMEGQKELEEGAIKKALGNMSASRYTNLKRHLYQQILNSLRLIQKEKKANIKIREYIDFAYILYDKGLYMQALRVLEKAKKLAARHHTDFSTITIIEIEKMIHSRHITRTDTKSIDGLMLEATVLADTISNRVKLSNLRMILHKFYVEHGHARNESDSAKMRSYFGKDEELVDPAKLGTMERVYLSQANVWYYYILNNFERCYKHALEWVELFRKSKELQHRDVDLYLRGYHYLLTSAYNIKHFEAFGKHLAELEALRKDNYSRFNVNTQIISFLYVHNARLNKHFLEGSFAAGLETIKSTRRRISRYRDKLDAHKIMVLQFKIAWMFLGNDMPEKASAYLDRIIRISTRSLRDDIQAYARLMNLIAHYDMENFRLLPSLVKSYNNFFEKVEQKNEFQRLALSMFRQLTNAPILDRKEVLLRFHAKLKKLQQDPFEQRAFLYLEILPWLEARIKGQTLSQVIQASLDTTDQ
ncbi:MAG: hypothetical protein GYB31_16165 [Bacteroidetes bacterium]|nr:hypothetical protein [Bacteroidota bacterium]